MELIKQWAKSPSALKQSQVIRFAKEMIRQLLYFISWGKREEDGGRKKRQR